MKKQTAYIMMIAVLLSCDESNNSNNADSQIFGTWKLVQMTSSMQNDETTGAAMDWQETYELYANGTFRKSRETQGVITVAAGTYNEIDNPNERLLELNYNNQSELIGSCTSRVKETLIFESDIIFYNTWNACDGPGLKYKKME